MKIYPLKYAAPFLIYLLALISFFGTGVWCWLALLYAWILIPAAELFQKPDPANMETTEEELAKENKWYDYVLYATVFFQYAALIIFLWQMKHSSYNFIDGLARVYTMGLLCGVFGINAGHELGHRSKKYERLIAKALLLSSLYMHFFIEHNKGHHKNVATRDDPASARLWEPVYFFYFRSVIFSYLSAWKIAGRDAVKNGGSVFSFKNEMLQLHLTQLGFIAVIFFTCGWLVTVYYLMAAAVGIALLETVNYIEHYGLTRKEINKGKFERTMPRHSWNSDHIIGRLMLFELSRHSDHHYLASRKYQLLRHHDDAPQMPTGYPGMMILALVPPLWFYVMHRQMRHYNIPTEKNMLKAQGN
ncbi:MAG TPA: alkane 1-monooxygenase [Panacibacter sp.]|nr:alkane 1-monooxygenase [Panacibacter sp.]